MGSMSTSRSRRRRPLGRSRRVVKPASIAALSRMTDVIIRRTGHRCGCCGSGVYIDRVVSLNHENQGRGRAGMAWLERQPGRVREGVPALDGRSTSRVLQTFSDDRYYQQREAQQRRSEPRSAEGGDYGRGDRVATSHTVGLYGPSGRFRRQEMSDSGACSPVPVRTSPRTVNYTRARCYSLGLGTFGTTGWRGFRAARCRNTDRHAPGLFPGASRGGNFSTGDAEESAKVRLLCRSDAAPRRKSREERSTQTEHPWAAQPACSPRHERTSAAERMRN